MVGANLELFGPSHLLALASIPAAAWLLVWLTRRGHVPSRTIRIGLGIFLIIVAAGWYIHEIPRGSITFPYGLPLQLSDLALALTTITAFSLSRRLFDMIYYWVLVGFTLAVLTPDILPPFPDFYAVHFFLVHGGGIVAVLYFCWTGILRPRPGSYARSFLVLHIFGLSVLVFNVYYGTNYMFLLRKPESSTVMDYLGPWPVYVLIADAIGMSIGLLLYIPFRHAEPAAAWQQ